MCSDMKCTAVIDELRDWFTYFLVVDRRNDEQEEKKYKLETSGAPIFYVVAADVAYANVVGAADLSASFNQVSFRICA